MTGARSPRPTHLAFRALIALGMLVCPLSQFSAASPVVLPVRSAPPPGPTGQPEEEKSEQTKSGAACTAPARGVRRVGRPAAERSAAAPARVPDCKSGALPRAAAADPFRNGLGCPFRC